MTPEADHVPTVWQEVRRRRVLKVVVAYLSLAFGAVVAGIFLDPLIAVPGWIGRVMLGTLVLGFPAAVVLSWTYDITPTGVVKTPDDVGTAPPAIAARHAWLVLTMLGISAGVILHLLP